MVGVYKHVNVLPANVHTASCVTLPSLLQRPPISNTLHGIAKQSLGGSTLGKACDSLTLFGIAITQPVTYLLRLPAFRMHVSVVGREWHSVTTGIRALCPLLGSSWAHWAVALVTRFRAVLAEMCFSAMSLGLNYAVPASRRGAYNGFGSAVSSIGRMADPSLGAPMYAFSITNGLPALPLGRCLVMEYIVAMLAVLSWLSWSMPPSLQRPCVEDNPR